ncbi:hypothetical protein [Methylobacterium cerastii]|uniref:hypothetical protein n=1 Tax=Methylobacterium cerastii TaxID=932741 RepID=UPI001EE39F0D|nr:hypothetical protein [Methylobacterium cerastii]
MRDWPVKRLSRSEIWRDSLDLRRSTGIHGQSQIDFLDLLRNRLPKLGGRFSKLEVVVQEDDQLHGLPALTRYVRGGTIRVFVTKTTERDAILGINGGQEILGHELGHVRYHEGEPKAYLAGDF